MKILVLSGPNLDRLGERDVFIYGNRTLPELHGLIEEESKKMNIQSVCLQSNHEGELVTLLGKAKEDKMDGVILNAGAYTHTSIALLDAILCCKVPVVEVHISNPQARESFRKKSLIARACLGSIAGFGVQSYLLALKGLAYYLEENGQLNETRF